jgi:hypothetical protein
MLKNAIESAYYSPDSRKRRHNRRYSYEEGLRIAVSWLRSLDYGCFLSRRTPFSSDFFATASVIIEAEK